MKKALIALVVIIAALAVVIALRPDTFRVERSTEIDSPRDIPYGMVADFQQWPSWSPWEKLDPNMKRSFEGTGGAEGSTYGWVGNEGDGPLHGHGCDGGP
jgi:hypothetical protein